MIEVYIVDPLCLRPAKGTERGMAYPVNKMMRDGWTDVREAYPGADVERLGDALVVRLAKQTFWFSRSQWRSVY